MGRGALTSFLDGFAMAGLFGPLRRHGAPSHPFAPSKSSTKSESVIDSDFAGEGQKSLRGNERSKPPQSEPRLEPGEQDQYKAG